MPKFPVEGKTVIVTGAASGIGAATTRALIAKGANVALVDLTQESVDAVAGTLPADQVLALAADVTDYARMQEVVAEAVGRFGKVDVVFANAGIARPTTVASADLDEYERVLEVDLFGVIRTVKAALPQIIENKGHVLITSSIYSFFNGVINSSYSSSKAAVEQFGRSLRIELAAEGATCGVLYPGFVTTPITAVARGQNEAVTKIQQRIFVGPLGTFIEPEQIASAAVKGIEGRKPRTIEPKRWVAASALRGAFNVVADFGMTKDAGSLKLVRRIDREERERQSAAAQVRSTRTTKA
ncbi:MAG: SDR family NAD(P)-dependent oxidoreductase [Nocardioidaceae bacterium]|nr:SDR family NAD(P)-dependent oxidoreductase [Nocardioidaceae bacterium]